MTDQRDPARDDIEFRRLISSITGPRARRHAVLLAGFVLSLVAMVAALSASPLLSFVFVVTAALCADRLVAGVLS